MLSRKLALPLLLMTVLGGCASPGGARDSSGGVRGLSNNPMEEFGISVTIQV